MSERTSREAPGPLLKGILSCDSCKQSQGWESDGHQWSCLNCRSTLLLENGTLMLETDFSEPSIDFHQKMVGPRFVGKEFSQDMRIYFTNKRYVNILSKWFPSGSGPLLDLGAGDGRLSLWALEAGFFPVVAVDCSASNLLRIREEADRRGHRGLYTICGNARSNYFCPGSFRVILLFEVLGYFTTQAERAQLFAMVGELLNSEGRFALCEFTRFGRMLSDVVAMNLENIRLTTLEGTRLEKDGANFSDSSVTVRHLDPEDLMAELLLSGLETLERMGVSPLPMLFHHAHTFTSYPLRPRLDDDLRKLLERMDDLTSQVSSLARNVVTLAKVAAV